MKNILINCVLITVLIILLSSCTDDFINRRFVNPQAKFEILEGITPGRYQVYETVTFENQGAGQNFVVFTGDKGHVYGKKGDLGAPTTAAGVYNYSYREVGDYTVVWIATSITQQGEVIESVDSTRISIVAENGGLEMFTIPNIMRMTEYATLPYFSSEGVFVSPSKIVCPLLYSAWSTSSTQSIKRSFALEYTLTSSFAKLIWVDQLNNVDVDLSLNTAKRLVWFTDDHKSGSAGVNSKLQVQHFKVITASGEVTDYLVAPIVIPVFTSFSVNVNGNDYQAIISRDLTTYDNYNAVLTLPAGTNLSELKPKFTVLNNDPTLTDGTNYKVLINNVDQISGNSSVDFSSKSVTYDLTMGVMGDTDPLLRTASKVTIIIR